MIKNQALRTVVDEAALLVNSTVGLLWHRRHVIDLKPMEANSNPGYIWKRVFLKERRQP